jgi:hypothetical protein
MFLRVGNYDVHPDCISMIGPGSNKTMERVYLDSSAIPTVPSIEIGVAQAKTLRTQLQAWGNQGSHQGGSANAQQTTATPAQRARRTTTGRTTTGRRTGAAGEGGGAE